MKDNFLAENCHYEYFDDSIIKRINDQELLDKVNSTYSFLKLSEIYQMDVKDDYGKQKIAGLRVEFIRHQLDLLIRECFARGINHGLKNSY